MPEAGAPEGAAPDAAAPDSGPDPRDGGAGCPVVLTDNFDDPTFARHWTSKPGAELVTTEFFSPPRALATDVLAGQPNGYLELVLEQASRLLVTVRLRVLKKGKGEVDLFNLQPESAAQRPIAFAHSGSLEAFVLQSPKQDGSGDDRDLVPFSIDDWHLLAFDLDIRTKSVTFRVDDKSAFKKELPADWQPGVLRLRVGASFVNAIAEPFLLRFDDVEVRSCPP